MSAPKLLTVEGTLYPTMFKASTLALTILPSGRLNEPDTKALMGIMQNLLAFIVGSAPLQ